MLYFLRRKAKQTPLNFKEIGRLILATIFKCALKLFLTTFVSSERAEKTATITVTKTTEVI